jgi:hypothetical protein
MLAFQVITSAVLWLLNYQSSDGAFIETEAYSGFGAFHSPMAATIDNRNTAGNTTKLRYAALTAHVLIALEETASSLVVSKSIIVPLAKMNSPKS